MIVLCLVTCTMGSVMGYWGFMALMRRRIVVDKPPRVIEGRKAVQLGIIYLFYAIVMLVGGGFGLFDLVTR